MSIFHSPRPIRGRARGRSSAGTTGAAAAEMRRRRLRDRTGDIRTVGAVAGVAPNTQGARRRPKPRGPGAPAARHPWIVGAASYRGTDRQVLLGPDSGG